MSALRKIKRAGKKATKFHYSTTYQSVLIECHSDKWTPHMIQVAWHRRGRRIVSQILPWLSSPDTPTRGMAVWPEPEVVESTITLYKGPKDKSYEHKDWDYSVIDVDKDGQRKVLATCSVDMVKYASALPFEHELQLKLKPVSKKIKKILLELSLSSVFLKEGKATDDDMISLASMMSVSNLSMICNLEDDDEDYTIRRFGNGRSISPEIINAAVPSTDKLIDWAQEVTTGYSGVKIINMTKSWRNGLAFCAIIHYYRPDLLEFSPLSSQSIKENNRLAFDIAKELGIACPLTPDMMLLRDIPDKLAVTAFVYQMFNYFTMAVPSAIIKTSTGNSKEDGCKSTPSPLTGLGGFDFTEIEKLTCKNLSPTINEVEPASKRNMTTNKWSKHSLKEERELMENQQEEEIRSHGDSEGVVHTPEKHDDNEPVSHSTPVTKGLIEPKHSSSNSNNDIDMKPVITSSNKTTPINETSSSPTPASSNLLLSNKTTPPKECQSITTTNNDSSSCSPIPMRSNLSLQLSSINDNSNSDDSRIIFPDISSDTTGDEESSKLPSSNDTAVTSLTEEEQKKEYYRKQMKKMMASAGIKSDIATFDAISSRTRKMIQQQTRRRSEGNMLRTASSSPSLASRGVLGSVEKMQEEEREKAIDSHSSTTTTKSETQVDSNRNENDSNQSSQTCLTSSINLSPNFSRELTKDNKSIKSIKSTSQQKLSPTDLKTKNMKNRSSSLVILPPEPRRSSLAKKMAEEPPKTETDGENVIDRPDRHIHSMESSTSSTESPLAWSTHTNDLTEAILVSTSDYIKNELLLIHKDLKPLEERAVTVETEIREAMAKGDSNKEELLTVEYFKLLNEKNSLIKKQIELNLLEKEEDLQKTQFFINRELRPLAAIPEDQKTDQQKLREQQLLKELLELMDEREWLDQRLTNTTNSSIVESSTMSPDTTGGSYNQTDISSSSFSASLKSKFSRDRSAGTTQRGEKDCVIS